MRQHVNGLRKNNTYMYIMFPYTGEENNWINGNKVLTDINFSTHNNFLI